MSPISFFKLYGKRAHFHLAKTNIHIFNATRRISKTVPKTIQTHRTQLCHTRGILPGHCHEWIWVPGNFPSPLVWDINLCPSSPLVPLLLWTLQVLLWDAVLHAIYSLRSGQQQPPHPHSSGFPASQLWPDSSIPQLRPGELLHV